MGSCESLPFVERVGPPTRSYRKEVRFIWSCLNDLIAVLRIVECLDKQSDVYLNMSVSISHTVRTRIDRSPTTIDGIGMCSDDIFQFRCSTDAWVHPREMRWVAQIIQCINDDEARITP